MLTSRRIVGLIAVAFLVAALSFTYWETLQWMYDRYMGADSYYSHGFLIPFISLFFVWQQRDQLHHLQMKMSWAGFVLIVFSLCLHLLGTVLYVFSVSGFSLFFLIIGLTLFLTGKEITRSVWFPLCFLIFMFPMPMAVISLVSFPLKMFAAKAGVWIVSLVGVPVYGEGFNITIPAGLLLVGNPCSGLRSLIAFLALGAVLAYMSNLSNVKKIVLFLCSIPVAVVSNLVRVPILILVSHYYGLEAAAPDTFVHTGSGLLVFVLGFLLLLSCVKVLEWRT